MSSAKIVSGLFRVFLIFVSFLFFSCGKDKDLQEIEMGYTYFPLDSGFYREFLIESYQFDVTKTDTSIYYLREELGKRYFLNGEDVVELEQFRKDSLAGEWIFWNLQTVRVFKNNYVLVDNNQRVVMMTFPIEKNKTWDANVYIASSDFYKYNSVNQPYQLNSEQYLHTVYLEQEPKDPRNLLNTDYRYEVYAQDIGMIEKYTETTTKTQLNAKKIGYQFHQKLLKYGKD